MTFQTAEAVARRVLRARRGRHLLLLLDFDGTLCEFAPEPQLVRLPVNTAAALATLAASDGVTVGFISGRRTADLRSHLPPLSGIYMAGCHGLEIEAADGDILCAAHASASAAAHDVATAISLELPRWPGTFVEDKHLSIALHVRNATPRDGAAAAARLRELAAGAVAEGRLRVLEGAGVTELLPAGDADKGRALERIRRHVGARVGPVFTVFAGDDVTDEDALRAVADDGLGIAVGARAGRAQCRLDGTASMGRLLEILADELTPDAQRRDG